MQLKLVIDALIALRHTRTKKQVGNALRQSSIPRNELLLPLNYDRRIRIIRVLKISLSVHFTDCRSTTLICT